MDTGPAYQPCQEEQGDDDEYTTEEEMGECAIDDEDSKDISSEMIVFQRVEGPAQLPSGRSLLSTLLSKPQELAGATMSSPSVAPSQDSPVGGLKIQPLVISPFDEMLTTKLTESLRQNLLLDRKLQHQLQISKHSGEYHNHNHLFDVFYP